MEKNYSTMIMCDDLIKYLVCVSDTENKFSSTRTTRSVTSSIDASLIQTFTSSVTAYEAVGAKHGSIR